VNDTVEVLRGTYAGRIGAVVLLDRSREAVRFPVEFGGGADELIEPQHLTLAQVAVQPTSTADEGSYGLASHERQRLRCCPPAAPPARLTSKLLTLPFCSDDPRARRPSRHRRSTGSGRPEVRPAEQPGRRGQHRPPPRGVARGRVAG